MCTDHLSRVCLRSLQRGRCLGYPCEHPPTHTRSRQVATEAVLAYARDREVQEKLKQVQAGAASPKPKRGPGRPSNKEKKRAHQQMVGEEAQAAQKELRTLVEEAFPDAYLEEAGDEALTTRCVHLRLFFFGCVGGGVEFI